MPVLTVDDIKEQILLEIGDLDANGDPLLDPDAGVVADRIDFLWDRYAAKDLVAPGLRELYVKQAALRMLRGLLAPRVLDVTDTVTGNAYRANQLWTHYGELLADVMEQIRELQRRGGHRGGYRYGRIRASFPASPGLPATPSPELARAAGSPTIVSEREATT
jgi:hypothetical protein